MAIADIFTGGADAERAARQAASQIQFDPADIFGGSLGNVRFRGGQFRLGPSGLEQQFGGLLGLSAERDLGANLTSGPFGAAGTNLQALQRALSGIQAPGATTTVGGPSATLQGPLAGLRGLLSGAQGAQTASDAARGALGSFDPDAFAGQQFQRLEALAAPSEETAATSLLNRLYGTGRLGVTTGGRQRELTELATSQELARNQRGLQALQLSGQEQDRLGRQAGLFGGLAQQGFQAAGGLNLSQLSELFNQQLQGQQLTSQQQESMFGQLLQGQQFGRDTALQRFQAGQAALGFGQSAQQARAQRALQSLGALQQFQQSPLELLRLSIGAGTGELEASQARAGMISNAAQNRATGNAQFFSGLLGAIPFGNFGGGN